MFMWQLSGAAGVFVLFKRTEEEMSPQHFIQHLACVFAFSVPDAVIVIISTLGD